MAAFGVITEGEPSMHQHRTIRPDYDFHRTGVNFSHYGFFLKACIA
jgi:hypothetical protein